MIIVFKGISTLERINYDCSVFESLNMKCFLSHGCINMLKNYVNTEKEIKHWDQCHQFIYFLSKISFLHLKLKVSIICI